MLVNSVHSSVSIMSVSPSASICCEEVLVLTPGSTQGMTAKLTEPGVLFGG
uniref:Uncharacterized protein n=1 Tax=Kalanchoe fedtschenkoi TaxID=63787 RepID=A0A7N0VDH9_KALFE